MISSIWKKQPGEFFCVATKSGSGKWQEKFFHKSDLSTVQNYINQNRDKDIYFCPHGFSRPRRRSEYACPPKLFWSDLDEVPINELKYKPTVAIESSPGRYVGLWFTRDKVTDEMNQSFTYAMGADRSGWDYSQVLRVPNTTNYKYNSTPTVKLLWYDKTCIYRATSILRTITKKIRELPNWLVKELKYGTPVEGKRSEMIWKLENALLEHNIPEKEVFRLIKESPWNKFKGRKDEDRQLNRELKKVSQKLGVNKKPQNKILFQNMEEVEAEELDWLYYPYLALGELTILEGDPGLGKSYLAQMIALKICDGGRLPSVRRVKSRKGTVVYFDIENSAGTVTKKRLQTNGLKNLKSFIQCEEPFSIQDEDTMEEIYNHLENFKPLLIVFDTLNTYLGKADAFKGTEAQQAFSAFREMSKRFHCSVLVLRHLTKNSKEKALYRGQGSIAFAGLARVVMTVGELPDDPDTRVMSVTKINVTKPPKSLTFNIQELPDTLKEKDRSKFVWGEFIDIDSDDILNRPNKDKENIRGLKEDAEKFLKSVLKDGPMPIGTILADAEIRNISERTLRRASESLGIHKTLVGSRSKRESIWSLPETLDD